MGLAFWNDTQRHFFRRRDDGDWDFFPSVFGRGYRMNAEQHQRISIALRHYESLGTIAFLGVFGLGTLVGAFEGSIMRALEVFAIFFVALRGYRFIRLRLLCRDLPRTEGHNAEVWRDVRARALALPLWQIVYLLLTAPLIGLFGLFMLWHGISDGDSDILIIGLICLLVGIAGTWCGIAIWRVRWRSKRQVG